MAKGLNRVTIIGNLGQDPETKYLPSGDAVTNLSVATDESYKDKNTGQFVPKTEWHRVSMFGKQAEVCGQYLRKGSKAYFEGKLETRKWQDQSGNDRYTTEIKAFQMLMLDGKSDGDSQSQSAPVQEKQQTQSQQPPADDDFDESIPF